MIELSQRTENLLQKLFTDPETRDLARNILVEECGENIPLIKNPSPEGLERIRFSVLKLSGGDLNKLGEAVKSANTDWRDLFMAAGFGEDTDAHNNWYAGTIEN
jgi:hypothetical protein